MQPRYFRLLNHASTGRKLCSLSAFAATIGISTSSAHGVLNEEITAYGAVINSSGSLIENGTTYQSEFKPATPPPSWDLLPWINTSGGGLSGNDSIGFEVNAHNPGSLGGYVPTDKTQERVLYGDEPYALNFNGNTYTNTEYMGFAVDLPSAAFQGPTLGDVQIAQYWQGSPYEPPLSITVSGATANSATYQVLVYNNAYYDNYPNSSPTVLSTGSITFNTWTTFVVMATMGYDNNGQVALWQDGVQQFNDSGINVGYNPNVNPYPNPPAGTGDPNSKFDCYIGPYRDDQDTQQEEYFDQIRWGSTYSDALPQVLYWNNASANGLWDINTSGNWDDAIDDIDPAKYTDTVYVNFDDAHNNGNYNVTLNTTVNPGEVTVNNSSGNYLISGTGSIGGLTGLEKDGSAKLMLAIANTYSGATTINSGILDLDNQNAVQNSTVIDNQAAGGLAFTSGIDNPIFGGLSGSGAITLQDAGSAAVTLSVGNNGANTTYSGALSGSGALTKIGAGTLILSGANTYTGNTTVSTGTLDVLGSLTHSATTISGGTLEGPGGSVQGVTLTSGTLTAHDANNSTGTLSMTSLSTSSGGTLLFNVGAGSAVDLLAINGSASLAGGTGITFSAVGAAAPTSGENVSILTSTSLSNSISATNGVLATGNAGRETLYAYQGGTKPVSGPLSTDSGFQSSTNDLFLYTTGSAASLQWATGTVWNVQNTSAWWNTGASATDKFYQYDNVSFGDTYKSGTSATSITSYTVTLNTAVTPGSVSVNNSAGNYLISGSGSIGGAAGLVKEGSDNLTLSTVNTYSGGTTIGNGTLFVGANGALPNGGIVTLGDGTNNGTLDLNGFSATVGGLSNSGVGTQTITDSSANTSALTFAGGTSTFSGVISGAQLYLTVSSGSLTLSGTETYGGATSTTPPDKDTLVSGGSLTISGSDTNAGGITINSPGILNVASVSLADPIGGVIVDEGTLNATSATASVTDLTGSGMVIIGTGDVLTISPALNIDVITGTISGTGALVFSGLGTSVITLSGTNAYTGTTTINSGTVEVTNNNSLGPTTGGIVTINAGGTLDLGASSNTLVLGARTFDIAGAGASGAAGAIENNSSQQQSAFENITLIANATIGGTGRMDMGHVAGTLSLGSYTLTDADSGNFGLDGDATVKGTGGNIIVTAGDMTIQNSETISSANDSGGVIIYDGNGLTAVTAGFFHTTGTINLPMYFNGVDNTIRQDDNNTNSTVGSNMFLNSLVTVNPDGNGTAAGSLTLTGNISDVTTALTVGSVTVGTGAGSIVVDPSGTSGGTLTLSGTGNTYSGGITVDATGILVGGATNAFGVGGLTTNGGTAQLGGFNQTVAGLLGTNGSITDTSSTAAALITNGTGAYTYSGTIANGTGGGSLSLTQNGNGTQVLNGTNTYTGVTTISSGTLALGSTGSIVDSPIINVESGATFNVSAVNDYTVGSSQTLEGTGNVTGNVTVSGTLSPGVASPSALSALTVSGNVTLGGAFNVQVTPTTNVNDQLNAGTNAVTLGGTEDITTTGALTSGKRFPVIQGDVYGNFATVNLPSLTSGLSWNQPLSINTSITGATSTYQTNYAYSVAATGSQGYISTTGNQYTGLTASDNIGSRGTTLTFLGGAVTTPTSLSVQFSTAPAGNTQLLSDVAAINGTNSDTYVLQMSYSVLPTNGTLSPVLAAYNPSTTTADGQSLITNTFVSAVLLNTGGTSVEYNGAYAGQDVVGDYGINTSNDTVWAVLNYSDDDFVVLERADGDWLGTGSVNAADLDDVVRGLGGSTLDPNGNPVWSNYAFDGGTSVDAADLDDVVRALGSQEVTGNAVFSGGGLTFSSPSEVPEPGSLALLAVGGMGLLVRRRVSRFTDCAN